MDYCTTDDILRNVGVTEEQIEYNKLQDILSDATAETDRIIKTTCNPKLKYAHSIGNNRRSIILPDIPLLTVKNIRISDTDISPENYIFNQHGEILLLETSNQFFTQSRKPNVSIRYVYGWLDTHTDTNKTKQVMDGSVIGDLTIRLDNVDYLEMDDWVKIEGLDGNSEWTQIKEVNQITKEITCDLLYPHERGSTVFLGKIPDIVKRLCGVIGGMMGAAYMMGSTYDFATGYTIPDFSVQKGEPYPAFVKIINDLKQERDYLISQLPSWVVFV